VGSPAFAVASRPFACVACTGGSRPSRSGLRFSTWLLNDRFFGWFPKGEQRFPRLPLFGRFAMTTPTRFYGYSVVVLLIVYLACADPPIAAPGRVIVALRENERAAQSFGVRWCVPS